jgi:hypothetical protein
MSVPDFSDQYSLFWFNNNLPLGSFLSLECWSSLAIILSSDEDNRVKDSNTLSQESWISFAFTLSSDEGKGGKA